MKDELKKEFEKATAYELTDHDIERARLLLGIDLAARDNEQIHTATADNIRTFAYGCGNDNPLHCDPEYAESTRWGGVIAPTMMAGVVNRPMLGDALDADIKAQTKSVFRGIHVFISGGEWLFYRPIYPGDTLYSFTGAETLEVQPSEFAGRKVNRITRQVKINQRAEIVAVYRYREILTERKTAREKGKYSKLEPAKYDDEAIAKIDEIYAQDVPRGADRWYFEDAVVGAPLRPSASGPLTTTDIVTFHAGGYGWVPYGLRVGRYWHKNRKRIAPFYIKNENGIPDVAQRLHWDSAWAQAIGNPMAYDYGVMRENYVYRYLTDLAGDDGWVYRQYDEIRKFNYMGDVQFISGEITGKREDAGLNLVDVKVKMTNQRGEDTLLCDASIALPSKHKPVLLPEPPAELKERAIRMMARHWELNAARRRGKS
ncbi:MaoC family dehydratase N-terminal domain-containing protein [Hydrocarboniphaga sp.]|uniref:FAS1-like dehydratase domain-containing protein n=1 Tax=Hydrocarboniphaga sp. TaxID=2033016 RepID=UPI002614A878|nr:MaoC family dehydratase N-terminal domain-containing protein [Hydrocarboniphaga sp.]